MQQITVPAIALVDKHSRFDPAQPENARAGNFAFFSPDTVLDKDSGVLGSYWTKNGYVMVGTAQITIDLLPRDVVTANTVVALRAQKTAVQAEATAECTHIDAQIQSLLAITNEA